MLTPLGKELRKIRIDRTISLKALAESLGITSAYLSSIEHGKRQITDDLFNSIVSKLGFSDEETNRLKHARAMSADNLTVNLKDASNSAKETMLAFARRFTELSPEEYEQIRKILSSKEGK